MKKNSRIFIADYGSMVGKAIRRRLSKEGFTNLLAVKDSSLLDLTKQRFVENFFENEKPEYCFIPSIKEGGIAENIAHPAQLIYQNIVIHTSIIHAAWKTKVKKLILFASSCVYPKDCSQPLKEEYILSGLLEPTNEAYAVAKIAGIKMCQAYNRQYRTRFISLIPATIYGPNDNFDLNNSHVIAALIRKFHKAIIRKRRKVTLWGKGRVLREFIYIDDLVEASLFLMRNCVHKEVINVGCGFDISIYELAKLIKKAIGFKGEIKFDSRKPEGVKKKLLDVSYISSLGWKPKVSLQEGLERTIQWFFKNIKSLKFLPDK